MSQVFAKPSWQLGTPTDGQRDVPDLSLAASPSHDGYLICTLDTSITPAIPYCTSGWANANGYLHVEGGTSCGAPAFAGMVALLAQALGGAGLGNINPTLYQLAAAQPSAFHDVTSGNNIVACEAGSVDCGCPGGTPGCSPAEPDQFGYTAGPGYDLATGLGSVEMYNLWKLWPTPTTIAVAATRSTFSPGGSSLLTATVQTNRLGPALSGETVTFLDGSEPLGAAPLVAASGSVVGATATMLFKTAVTGHHVITARFGGDGTYFAATSAPLTVEVSSPSCGGCGPTGSAGPACAVLAAGLVRSRRRRSPAGRAA